MSFSISGKTAIVTGAANGVGLAIARHFLAAGCNVMCADRDEAGLRAQLGDMCTEDGKIAYFAGDLRQKLTQTNLISATMDRFEGIDILVNACRQVASGDPLKAKDDMVDELLQQNLLNGLRLSQLVARKMIAERENADRDAECNGVIINLSSIAATRAPSDLMGYSIATAAQNQMTRTLALALAPHRIRVNAIAMGSVMSASLQEAIAADGDLRAGIIQATPMRRIAPATDLAETAQFLASDASSFITGQVITVDGGRSLCDAMEMPMH